MLYMQMPACILGIERKTDWHTPGVGSQGTSPLSRGTPLTHQIVLFTETKQAFKLFSDVSFGLQECSVASLSLRG